jgi:hypothetical protein
MRVRQKRSGDALRQLRTGKGVNDGRRRLVHLALGKGFGNLLRGTARSNQARYVCDVIHKAIPSLS